MMACHDLSDSRIRLVLVPYGVLSGSSRVRALQGGQSQYKGRFRDMDRTYFLILSRTSSRSISSTGDPSVTT